MLELILDFVAFVFICWLLSKPRAQLNVLHDSHDSQVLNDYIELLMVGDSIPGVRWSLLTPAQLRSLCLLYDIPVSTRGHIGWKSLAALVEVA